MKAEPLQENSGVPTGARETVTKEAVGKWDERSIGWWDERSFPTSPKDIHLAFGEAFDIGSCRTDRAICRAGAKHL